MAITLPSTEPTPALLDLQRIAAVDAEAVRRKKPYPFLHAERLLSDEGYDRLRRALPDPSRFSAIFGRRRPHGQQYHDRYALQYRRWQSYPEPWPALIAEFEGDTYRRFVQRLVGRDDFVLHYHWHYTPTGCSVSPHCDAPWKFASHIFYFNTEEDWDASWGGDTLVLDDGGRHPSRSAPKFDDFDREISSPSLGNRSLFFVRGDHSWHGVRPLTSPEDRLRKVFIVEVRKRTPLMLVRTSLGF
jgi:hypothetical protein